MQNLVQFGVVKPKRTEGTYCFDPGTLLVAKVALYLKESLGTRTSALAKLMDAFSASKEKLKQPTATRVTKLQTGFCALRSFPQTSQFLQSIASGLSIDARNIAAIRYGADMDAFAPKLTSERAPNLHVRSVIWLLRQS